MVIPSKEYFMKIQKFVDALTSIDKPVYLEMTISCIFLSSWDLNINLWYLLYLLLLVHPLYKMLFLSYSLRHRIMWIKLILKILYLVWSLLLNYLKKKGKRLQDEIKVTMLSPLITMTIIIISITNVVVVVEDDQTEEVNEVKTTSILKLYQDWTYCWLLFFSPCSIVQSINFFSKLYYLNVY